PSPLAMNLYRQPFRDQPWFHHPEAIPPSPSTSEAPPAAACRSVREIDPSTNTLLSTMPTGGVRRRRLTIMNQQGGTSLQTKTNKQGKQMPHRRCRTFLEIGQGQRAVTGWAYRLTVPNVPSFLDAQPLARKARVIPTAA
ncbi:hypothetical protein L249_1732, partial [Ophiocordyceps polyrhachis-furcata BCC 54312]